MPRSSGEFNDAPQWYWGVANQTDGSAKERFVIASGQQELWRRVRVEVDSDENCAWHGFGPENGNATLADCFEVFIRGREVYGAHYNRVSLELAQVPAFARFIKDRPSDLCNWVSNPISISPLERHRYSDDAMAKLGGRIASTLGLGEDWWL